MNPSRLTLFSFAIATLFASRAVIVSADDTLNAARAEAVRRAVATIAPALVAIDTVGGAQPIRKTGPQGLAEESFRVADGPTTGVILSADGLILTSSFNFARDPSVITVTLADNRRFVAQLLGRDLIRRVALLRIRAQGLLVARWADRGDVRVGQYAVACGRGLCGDTPHIALGIVSAANRRNGSALQTDAKTSPINYGGPLIGLDGQVLGLIVPMAGEGGLLAGAEWYDSGIGFAIYRDRINLVMDDLITGKTIEPGKIGVILGENADETIPILDALLPARGNVEILRVAQRSPAKEAGLTAGDRILALDGMAIGDISELQRRLSDRAAGEEISLSIKRRWRTLDVKIRLARIADIAGLEPPTDLPDEPPTTQPDTD